MEAEGDNCVCALSQMPKQSRGDKLALNEVIISENSTFVSKMTKIEIWIHHLGDLGDSVEVSPHVNPHV